MTPFAVWRSRLPTAIGNWFARDLVRAAVALVSDGRVALRAVEEARIAATVDDGTQATVGVEWATGTGPQALRSVCSCGGSGICAHIVAVIEAVRAMPESEPATGDAGYDWLPQGSATTEQVRARSIWPVITSPDGEMLSANFFLDSPRLRGVMRDPNAIVAMMDSTPADDWDVRDRELLRDEAVQEAFGSRTPARALARAMFALARHPRLRFDDRPSEGRHPSELPPFRVDLRGLLLRAVPNGAGFVPMLEDAEGARFSPAAAKLLAGPPQWLAFEQTAYLLDGSFDARKVVDAARTSRNGASLGTQTPQPTVIARAAPFLSGADRASLGVRDAAQPSIEARFVWEDEMLAARLDFVDRNEGARAPFSAGGGIAEVSDGFVRFTPEFARSTARRFVEAGFVPRGSDGFSLHGPDRAAHFVREELPAWTDIDARLDQTLRELAGGGAALGISVAARRSSEREDWFELAVDVSTADGKPLTPREVAALLAGAGRYADVRGKLIDVAALRERQTLLSDLTERQGTGFAALIALHDELHEHFDGVTLPQEVEELRERLRSFSGIATLDAPAAVADTLRGYQRKGLDFLGYLSSFRFGGILADDMGLGKTLQVIAHFLWRKQREGPAPSLVIAPTSVTHTWENEVAKFAPELTTLRLASGSDRLSRFDRIEGTDIVITSYALARLDAQALAAYRFRTLVLDEAQNAKNPASQIARVVRGLRAQHRIALTGTPVENSLRDLWAIFAFCEPGLLGSESSFRRRFEAPIALGDGRAVHHLRSRLEPFVLRRTKEDVAPELPERTEAVIECDLSPLQRRIYRGIADAARRDLFARIDDEGIERATVHVLAALTRLRQVCAHPALLSEEYRGVPEASAKFDAFLETVEEVLSGGHRLLVFSAFASMLRIMRGDLDARGIAYGYLDGSTKDRDRRTEVERFMDDAGPPLFLCSLKAGGVGLTLTAADYVVLYDPWWNPAVERQAIDRTHRIGQHRAVTAYRLVTRGTVEEKIRSLALRKAELSRTVIKADSTVAKSLSREDLEFLFADPEE